MKRRIAITTLAVCGIAGFCLGAGGDEASLPANEARFSNDDAEITVSIQANVYTYKVSNLGSSPIVAFEVAQYAAYNFQAPDGWQMDTSGRLFRAWIETPTTGIAPGETAQFSMRVSSKGAILGHAPAKLKPQSGRMIELADVWCPIPEPRSYIALVAGVILLIALLHGAIIITRSRRARKLSLSV